MDFHCHKIYIVRVKVKNSDVIQRFMAPISRKKDILITMKFTFLLYIRPKNGFRLYLW